MMYCGAREGHAGAAQWRPHEERQLHGNDSAVCKEGGATLVAPLAPYIVTRREKRYVQALMKQMRYSEN